MSRLLLVHWNRAEANERAARLRKAGHTVKVHWREGGEGLRELGKRPPDAIVIDLERMPSHGRAVATFLRQQKRTRHVPVVFVGGAAPKVKATRALLPDAAYTEWRAVRGAITRAIRSAPADPVVPDTMAGYSGTPLPKKLTIRPGSTLALLGAPAGFESTLGVLPEDVAVRKRAAGTADVLILFAKTAADMTRRFPAAQKAMGERGRLWIAWPKKASGLATDLTQAAVRRHGLDAGLVDFKICAIDETWSGLCFSRRK